MICKVINTISRYNMPIKGKTVVVGVSGGADSMALLNVLLELKDEYMLKVIACHVNHGIRGETADRDEKFVVEACKKLGVDVRVLKTDVPKLAKEEHLGIEECGRKVRYDFFNSVAEDVIIATAHTLSDRCETLLLNITRGSSVKGLCSIPAVRNNIVRPLIDCTRNDIENYCKEKNISFVSDETNFDDTYSRNRIRLNIIPELKKINPSVEKSILRLIKNSEEENDFLSDFSTDVLKKAKLSEGYDAVFISKQHTAVRKRVIFDITVNETGFVPEAKHVEMIDSILNGGKSEIIGNTIIEVKNGILRINPIADTYFDWEDKFNLAEDGSLLTAETPFGKIKAEIIHRNNLPEKHFVHNKVLDYDKICGTLVVRNRREKDKMKIAGSSCTKTLKKLFNEKHLSDRNKRAILSDDLGICWVSGIGCSDRCKIDSETKKILIIRED